MFPYSRQCRSKIRLRVLCSMTLIYSGHKGNNSHERVNYCLFLHFQRFAFRALRFLFSMERNRRLFKKLFPPNLYTTFIDVGHYNRDLSAYKPLVQLINGLASETIASIHENILELNQNRTPTHYIKEYVVFEHLGRGAFGSVYKVRKRAGQSFLALKEVFMICFCLYNFTK